MARRGAIHPRWEWSRWEASNIDVGPEGERTGVSESIEARERNSQALRHTSYPRRESNPHLRFRKPLFYPLNYGDKIRFVLLVSPICVTLADHGGNRADS